MKKIVKRRKTFRVNNPLAFGILCAMILVLVGGGIYALAAGLAVPAVRNYQTAHATPSPTPTEAPATPTPQLATPTPVQATPTPAEISGSDPTTGSGALSGHVIGIDPARGYSSTVKGAFSGVYANRLNYTIATLVEERLLALGAKVIRPLADVKDNMDSAQRAAILNSNDVELAVRIECNFVDTPDTRGALMWTNGSHKQVDECDKLAAAVLTAYLKATEFPTQEFNGDTIRHKGDDTFLGEVKAPVCTLIMGYISNEKDDRALNDADMQSKIADSIVDGILRYLGVEI